MKSEKYLFSLLTVFMLVVSAACSKDGLDKKLWKFSGSDVNRGIDHYYLKSSVKPGENGVVSVKTKLLSQKDDDAVEKSTGIKGAFYVEVEGIAHCGDSAFMVMSKEYLDRQGISLKIEKDGGNMDAVVEIKQGQALYPMIQDVCKEAANMKPRHGALSSAKKM